jgi:hypothetical protein
MCSRYYPDHWSHIRLKPTDDYHNLKENEEMIIILHKRNERCINEHNKQKYAKWVIIADWQSYEKQ